RRWTMTPMLTGMKALQPVAPRDAQLNEVIIPFEQVHLKLAPFGCTLGACRIDEWIRERDKVAVRLPAPDFDLLVEFRPKNFAVQHSPCHESRVGWPQCGALCAGRRGAGGWYGGRSPLYRSAALWAAAAPKKHTQTLANGRLGTSCVIVSPNFYVFRHPTCLSAG